MIKKKLPANFYRCKGIIYTAEQPDRRVILQAVGHRSDISLEDEWGKRTPCTPIVAIGAPDDIDHDELTTLFESCTASPISAAMRQ